MSVSRLCLAVSLLAPTLLVFTAPAAEAAPKHAAKPVPVKTVSVPASVVPAEPGMLPDMALGSPNAPVTVVEYASASCPHCAAWNAESWPTFRDKYVVTGKVRYVFRELLTSPAEYALTGFLIGRCAVAKSKAPGNSAPYFAVVNAFFQSQANYYKDGDMGPVEAQVTKLTGLSQMTQLDCVTDDKQIDAFYKTMNAHAEADKITGTPTFIVNGKRVEGHELKDIDAAIAAAH